VLADPDSLIARRAPDYGVPVYPLRLKKKRLGELRAMIGAINELKPDVISAHSSTDHWISAVARLFSAKKPSILRTRHVSAKVKESIGTRWLYRRGCEAIVTTGESIRQHLTENKLVPADKVISIPTGIDLQYFKSDQFQSARQRLSSRHSIAHQALLFGNIATLRSWKGQVDLIHAFSRVARLIDEARLLIVGDGPMESVLKSLVAELEINQKVLFMGHQNDVRDYFDALDVFVFPSYANEGVPQAILQAMAYGLPIITTRAGAIEEAVQGYPVTKFIEARNIDGLAHAMLAAAQIKIGRIKIPESIRDRISLDKMTNQMLLIYRNLVVEKA